MCLYSLFWRFHSQCAQLFVNLTVIHSWISSFWLSTERVLIFSSLTFPFTMCTAFHFPSSHPFLNFSLWLSTERVVISLLWRFLSQCAQHFVFLKVIHSWISSFLLSTGRVVIFSTLTFPFTMRTAFCFPISHPFLNLRLMTFHWSCAYILYFDVSSHNVHSNFSWRPSFKENRDCSLFTSRALILTTLTFPFTMCTSC